MVDTALELAPANRIFVVVGHQADAVRKSVTTPGIGFIEQAEQKGTGHALMVGREALARLDGLSGDPLWRFAAAARGDAAAIDRNGGCGRCCGRADER